MDSQEINLDPRLEVLDPNVQRLLIDAAQQWAREQQAAPPEVVAPADGGRPGDEQTPAPVDAITLLDTSTTEELTTYDIEVSIGGNLDALSVTVANDGSVSVQAAG